MSGVPRLSSCSAFSRWGDHGPRGPGCKSGTSITLTCPDAGFPRPQGEARQGEAPRAGAFHCPFALTFPCSLICRRDNYRSDTLERSVIWGPPQCQRSPRSPSLRVPLAPTPSRPAGGHGPSHSRLNLPSCYSQSYSNELGLSPCCLPTFSPPAHPASVVQVCSSACSAAVPCSLPVTAALSSL